MHYRISIKRSLESFERSKHQVVNFQRHPKSLPAYFSILSRFATRAIPHHDNIDVENHVELIWPAQDPPFQIITWQVVEDAIGPVEQLAPQ